MTGRYLLPTPLGTRRAVSVGIDDERALLRALFRSSTTIEFDQAGLASVGAGTEPDGGLKLIEQMRTDGLVAVNERPYRLGDQKLELVLPELLERLSTTSRGLLADNEGFLVSSAGFDNERAAQLAALATDLVALDRTCRRFMGWPEGREPAGWTASGPDGVGLSFFVLTIVDFPFVLALEGETRLRDPAFVWMVWALTHRYDNSLVLNAPSR